MMMSEFESRTNFFPGINLYTIIEEAYMESDLSKDEFCTAYKNNKNGLAEAIARKAAKTNIAIIDRIEKSISERDKRIETLTKKLEREQEWTPFESDRNVKQADYELLAKASSTRILTDDEAKNLITQEFGFVRSQITIYHHVNIEEINRHRQTRVVGEIGRLPVYNATDWNYIRFDCANWYYEMHDGSLSQYYC